MIKGIVVAVALTGSLVVGPAALATPADPVGAVPGYRLEDAGHDHGAKPDKPKPKPNKPKHPDKKKGQGDSAHGSGGYDSHRRHPRNW